jgi:SAM-dependent methyltransferase
MSLDRLIQAESDLRAGQAPSPPPEEAFVGGGDYIQISQEFLRYFVEIAGLEPSHNVLDVGCGIGRMAAGLSRYLDPEQGRYIGFDPVRPGIDWCVKAYADKPNFSFHWVDLYNELYRPEGSVLATRFRFPAEDAFADLAVLTSVFTHLYEPEIAAYLRELKRVVKPTGRIFATAYLFDGDAPAENAWPHLAFNISDPSYPHRWHVDGFPPLAAVCFKESYFAALVEDCTGRKADIRPGRWRGGPGPWFQDLVLI